MMVGPAVHTKAVRTVATGVDLAQGGPICRKLAEIGLADPLDGAWRGVIALVIGNEDRLGGDAEAVDLAGDPHRLGGQSGCRPSAALRRGCPG